jgi:hypothetical protein
MLITFLPRINHKGYDYVQYPWHVPVYVNRQELLLAESNNFSYP